MNIFQSIRASGQAAVVFRVFGLVVILCATTGNPKLSETLLP
jgi:hypothetical protein